jgi:hypothetical protein
MTPISHSLHSFSLKKFIKRGGVREAAAGRTITAFLLHKHQGSSGRTLCINRHLFDTSGVLI